MMLMALNGVAVPKMSHVFLDGVTVIQTTNVMALSFAEAIIAKTNFPFLEPSGILKQIVALVCINTTNKNIFVSIYSNICFLFVQLYSLCNISEKMLL